MMPDDLAKHPEGGRFRQIFKSRAIVTSADGRIRAALTHIYFRLDPGEVSRFHRVTSDEVWNLYRGTGLYLHTWDGSAARPETVELSARSGRFCHVVPAGCWQAAKPIADTVLAGCTVGPGFEYADFELIDAVSDHAAILRSIDGAWHEFIDP